MNVPNKPHLTIFNFFKCQYIVHVQFCQSKRAYRIDKRFENALREADL